MFNTPPAYVMVPGIGWKDFTVAAGDARIELEPREAMPAAPPLRFIVRDESGKPVAHASITGQSPSRYMPPMTDDRGEFSVPGLPPGGEVAVEVRQGDRMTDGPVHATAGRTDPVIITIRPGLGLAMTGRVVGPDGTPIGDAVVRVKYRELSQNGRYAFPRDVPFGNDEVRTAADGTFRTPEGIYWKGREFRVEATAEGFVSQPTDWVKSQEGDLLMMPVLALRRATTLRFVTGRVVDRDGKGIAGASVSQSGDTPRRTSTTTDGQGRYRIAGIPSGTALSGRREGGIPRRRHDRRGGGCGCRDPAGPRGRAAALITETDPAPDVARRGACAARASCWRRWWPRRWRGRSVITAARCSRR